MKIAIPVIDNSEHKYNIANGFNSTGSLCLYNKDTDQYSWIRIADLASNMGQLLPALISKDVDNVITRHIHPMALQVFILKGVKVYLSEGFNLEENIDLFNQSKLQMCDAISSYADIQICRGECSACSTECNEK